MKTREEQIRMLLHPERYTDEQLSQMLDDVNIPVPHAEEEWHRTRPAKERPLIRWAAIIIGVLMLSGISYAAVQMVRHTQEQAWNQGDRSLDSDGKAVDQGPVPLISPVTPDSIPQTRIFENAPLDEMITEIAQYYNKVADIESEKAHELRLYYKWEPKDALEDVVADLNHFDHVSLAIEDDKLIVKP